jgi:hypothetical protein
MSFGTFQTVAKSVIMVSLLLPVYFIIIFHIPPDPGTSYSLLQCLGRREVYFDFDYFRPGGYSGRYEICTHQEPNSLANICCKLNRVISILIRSNLLEIFLLGSVIFHIKSSTLGAAGLITPRALRQRHRYIGLQLTIK